MTDPKTIVRIDHWHEQSSIQLNRIEVSFMVAEKYRQFYHPTAASLTRLHRLIAEGVWHGEIVLEPMVVGSLDHWAYIAYAPNHMVTA